MLHEFQTHTASYQYLFFKKYKLIIALGLLASEMQAKETMGEDNDHAFLYVDFL